jgi:hypothetical protein
MPATDDKDGVFMKMSRCFNGRLTYSVGNIALSQINFGLDQGVFNNTQAMTPFARKFGVFNAKNRTYVLRTTPYMSY